jgi:hypothetical protein
MRTGASSKTGYQLLLAALLLVGCATDLVVRAPQDAAERPGSALQEVATLAVAVPPATGMAAVEESLGERSGGWGRQGGSIALTERPGDVVRRVVVQELEQAGHRVVETDPDVVLEVNVLEFDVEAPRVGAGWDVIAGIRVALRITRTPGSDEWSEFVYTAERTGHTMAPPGVEFIERILGEAVRDLGQLLAERGALATALEHHARRAG